DTLSQCDVILVLIGRGWLDARDEQGNRRLDQPNDPVREEVALALSSDALVIPVLLDDMPMPVATALPADLAPLARRQAATLHSDERRAHDTGVIVAMARAFVRRYPRQWLIQRLPLVLPLVTAVTIAFSVSRPLSSATDFSNTIIWVMQAVIWLLPLLYAARWRQWVFFRRLIWPYLIFVFELPFLLNAPSVVGFGVFALVLILEALGLRYFAANIPRSLGLALRAQAPRIGGGMPAAPVASGQPQGVAPRNTLRRWLTWGVVAAALLCMMTALAGGALGIGRDLASDAPELYWAANLQLAATYIAAAAIIGAMLALVLDVSETRRVGRSSPWGDAASVRGDSFTGGMQVLRMVLLLLPLGIFKVTEPLFFTHGAADATQYAIDLTLGSFSFALGALLSLIPLGRRTRRI
ncbi:MAG TPA: hypothetical protein VGR57_21250, partial [Ktedonobacterales bacterium]|nr:hypothetical protein [Ktedonobacterales bacterium]